MKKRTIILLQILLAPAVFVQCIFPNQGPEPGNDYNEKSMEIEADSTTRQLFISVESRKFAATLSSNATAAAFVKHLPLTVPMVELNDNEKYYRFNVNLPSKPVSPGRIAAGDLLLYNSNTIVLFYESINTSYAYTRIGKIDDPAGLAAAVGSGDVTVSFTLE